jgi:hypothetical protein
MKNQRSLFLSLVLTILSLLLGACSSMERLPDGTYLGIHGVSNLNHASSLTARWRDTGEKDAEGRPIMVEVKVEKLLGTRPDGTPIFADVKSGETINGPSVAGQMAVAAVAGPGTAVTNGIFGKEIAKIGKCAAGANCGTVFNNQAIAEALNQNKNEGKVGVTVGAGATSPKPPCAKDNTCGD